ncbi:hypothetical protein BB560_006432 [Smittium megazygosporum]|uniref:Uncharacterized protein n=1 Tax=Smittium megazygosporum TaxID=133381 RepID=A0A2T9Y680_9FUNG|nr:hypothetical protein BB560_006432 [Smittium megazygosporum]
MGNKKPSNTQNSTFDDDIDVDVEQIGPKILPKYIVKSGFRSKKTNQTTKSKALNFLKDATFSKLLMRDYHSAIKLLNSQIDLPSSDLRLLWKNIYHVIKKFGENDSRCQRFLQSALKFMIPDKIEIIKEILFVKVNSNDLHEAQVVMETYLSNPWLYNHPQIHGYYGILLLAIRESEIHKSKTNAFNNTQSFESIDHDEETRLKPQNTIDFKMFYPDPLCKSFQNDPVYSDINIDVFLKFHILTPDPLIFRIKDYVSLRLTGDLYNNEDSDDDNIEYSYEIKYKSQWIKNAEKHLKESVRLDKSGMMFVFYLIQIYITSNNYDQAQSVVEELLNNDKENFLLIKYALIIQKLASMYYTKKLLYYKEHFKQTEDYSFFYEEDEESNNNKTPPKSRSEHCLQSNSKSFSDKSLELK